MKKTKVKKRDNGITLIALVVTIVVLLILAGVSISLIVDNNGVIQKSKEARTQTKEAKEKEEITLAVAGSYGDNGEIDHNLLKDNLNKVEGIKPITKIETELEKDLEKKVTALPLIVYTNNDDVIHIDENGNVTRKAKPSKDVDLNGDGIINLIDVNLITNYYLNHDGLYTDEQKANADINEDGVIDVSDAMLLAQYVKGFIDDVG